MDTEDRISFLPKDITHAILACLPIRDVVRTSTLSRRWRYEWSTLSQIVIDTQLYPNIVQSEYEKKFVRFVDYLFLLHYGPINNFALTVAFESHPYIDRWILLLSRNGVKEFTLHLLSYWTNIYRLPSCFFSCSDITCLNLYGCAFIPPPTFSGFCSLKKLVLRGVTVVDNVLEGLLSGSPNLKKMELDHISGLSHLTISALRLVDMTIKGGCDIIDFKDTQFLASAFFSVPAGQHSVFKEGSRIIKLLGQMLSIQKLELSGDTLEYMALGDVPPQLPIQLPLNQLLMDLNFEKEAELLAAFCILRSSPIIEKLHIKVLSDNQTAEVSDEGWMGTEDFSCVFNHLQYVELIGFSGTKSELVFIEIVLANAPILKRMHIKFKDNLKYVSKIFIELVRFQRSSPKAQIIVPDLTLPK